MTGIWRSRALEMALKRRGPEAGLLHHSDQGCTYASEGYQAILDARRIICSMSRRGDCYDNVVIESFFSTVKSSPTASTASARPRWRCLTTSRCFISSGAVIRRSARSVRPPSNDAHRWRR
jgi:transposase InsO family protein